MIAKIGVFEYEDGSGADLQIFLDGELIAEWGITETKSAYAVADAFRNVEIKVNPDASWFEEAEQSEGMSLERAIKIYEAVTGNKATVEGHVVKIPASGPVLTVDRFIEAAQLYKDHPSVKALGHDKDERIDGV